MNDKTRNLFKLGEADHESNGVWALLHAWRAFSTA
jgi:hypothetical protein